MDGLNDHDEIFLYKTNAKKIDSDSDSINDYEEINVMEIYTFGTNPLNNDTDFDLINDYDELITYRTNPLENDTDLDKIIDFEEIYNYYTDPLSDDTDQDLLNDYLELFFYSTNPLLNDTDNDGYIDGYEIHVGTDPLNKNNNPGNILILIITIYCIMAGIISALTSCFLYLFFKVKTISKKAKKTTSEIKVHKKK
ncbi:MAG: hypothetical protein ACTSRP_16015 [Candidatus Helarchaeota archaeon]